MNDIRNSGSTPPSRSFRLDKGNARLAGVCSGIGNYFGIDPLLVRAGFVIATLVGFGSPVLIYAAIALIAD
ncbi:PspC domain-containing protein [Porphyrobacter sp. AAP82]|uniref:PspC domain-containing protein n=1 Tax=Porphyrobacter sp. AAP82 TaxID=1248917 RepID=UPI0002DF0EE8|nr:PspC domain-containing protein [Porphyrobacter sp. AAP82]